MANEIARIVLPSLIGVGGTFTNTQYNSLRSDVDGLLPNVTALLSDVDEMLNAFTFTEIAAQDGADNTSTTSTVGYSTAMDWDFLLPTGEWSIRVIGQAQVKHSAAGTVDARITIAGNAGSDTTRSVSSAGFEGITAVHAVTGVTSGTKTIVFAYKCNSAGTTTIDNPSIIINCWRTDV